MPPTTSHGGCVSKSSTHEVQALKPSMAGYGRMLIHLGYIPGMARHGWCFLCRSARRLRRCTGICFLQFDGDMMHPTLLTAVAKRGNFCLADQGFRFAHCLVVKISVF